MNRMVVKVEFPTSGMLNVGCYDVPEQFIAVVEEMTETYGSVVVEACVDDGEYHDKGTDPAGQHVM